MKAEQNKKDLLAAERIFFATPLSAKQNNAHSKISLGLCAILLRLYPITANVDVRAEATPLVGDPLEDSLRLESGNTLVAHQPSLAVLVTFDFWFLVSRSGGQPEADHIFATTKKT